MALVNSEVKFLEQPFSIRVEYLIIYIEYSSRVDQLH